MEPNKFRESRRAINRMCENIDNLIEQRLVEASKECFEQVNGELDSLRPLAEGEIQQRSVKNLGMKLNMLATRIGKLKAKKPLVRKRGSKGARATIEWDEARVGQLARPFLEKVMSNMAEDDQAHVFFGITGKGIRPNYCIKYGDDRLCGFTGSGHKPQERGPSQEMKNLSSPFSYRTIQTILEKV